MSHPSEDEDDEDVEPESKGNRAPKHQRVPPEYKCKSTVKKGLMRSLRWVEPVGEDDLVVYQMEPNGEKFLGILEESVYSVSKWMFYVSILHQMHFIRLLGRRPKTVIQWSLTKVDHVIALVSDGMEARSKIEKTSPELYETYHTHFRPLFGDIDTPRTRQRALVPICEQARTIYHTALSNHILTTFSSRLKRWFMIKILRWFVTSAKLDLPSKKSLHTVTVRLVMWILTNAKTDQYKPTDEQCAHMGLSGKTMVSFGLEAKRLIATVRLYLPDKPIQDSDLSKTWWTFVPWFYKILRDTESWLVFCKNELEGGRWMQQTYNRATRGVKLFHLCPQHKVAMQHLRITNRSLLYIGKEMKLWNGATKETDLQKDPDKYWNAVFRIREMAKKSRPHSLPEYSLSTDGVSISVMFAKKGDARMNKKDERKQAALERKVALSLDPSASAIPFHPLTLREFTPKVGVDPGLRKLFHAVRLLDDDVLAPSDQATEEKEDEGKEEKRDRKAPMISERREVSLSGREYRHQAGEAHRRYRAHHWSKQLQTKLHLLSTTPSTETKSDGKRENRTEKMHKHAGRSSKDDVHQSIPESKEIKRDTVYRKRKPDGEETKVCADKEEKRRCHLKQKTAYEELETKKNKKKRDKWSEAQERQIRNPLAAVNSQTCETTKVSSFAILMECLKKRAAGLAVEWEHKSKKRERRLKFDSYVAHQKADTFACRKLLDGMRPAIPDRKKDHRRMLIAFGNARFTGVRGLPRGPVKRIYEKLRKEYKRQCFVSPTCENYTSQKCPRCGNQTVRAKKSTRATSLTSLSSSSSSSSSDVTPPPLLKLRPARARWKIPRKEIITNEDTDTDASIVYGLKVCQNCSIVYDRDSMGAENILRAWNALNETGKRPPYLCPPAHKTTTKLCQSKSEVFHMLQPSRCDDRALALEFRPSTSRYASTQSNMLEPNGFVPP